MQRSSMAQFRPITSSTKRSRLHGSLSMRFYRAQARPRFGFLQPSKKNCYSPVLSLHNPYSQLPKQRRQTASLEPPYRRSSSSLLRAPQHPPFFPAYQLCISSFQARQVPTCMSSRLVRHLQWTAAMSRASSSRCYSLPCTLACKLGTFLLCGSRYQLDSRPTHPYGTFEPLTSSLNFKPHPTSAQYATYIHFLHEPV